MRAKHFFIVVLACCAVASHAEDHIRLKDGRLISGAVLRQDTIAVYLTTWESRHERFPEFQVFGRDEVESIWIGAPPQAQTVRRYSLHSGLAELSGGFAFQTWASSVHERRFLAQLSLQGGYSITKLIGFELAADFTAPWGKRSDAEFDALRFGHQVAAHVVASLDRGKSFVPFVFAGGGSALEVPRAGLIETTREDVRSLVDVGAGVKFGFNGRGLRAEVRHAYYSWSPDELTEDGVRQSNQNADATTLRVFFFTYF